MTSHLKGKRHQKKLQRMQRVEEYSESVIYVRGFPRGTLEEDLNQTFTQFGEVKKVSVTDANFAFLEFADKSSALKAIESKAVFFGGRKLSVKARQVKPGASIEEKKELKRKHKDELERSEFQRERQEQKAFELVIKKMGAFNEFNKQMDVLRSHLELSQTGQELRETVIADLRSVFELYLPGSEVIPFGSAVSGFGVASSDLDLYLDLSNLAPHDLKKEEIKFTMEFDDMPEVELTDRGLIIKDDINVQQQIKIVCCIISKAAVGIFSRPLRIPSQRCPLIKSSHTPTRIPCDITFNNRLAVQNTRLLKMYASLSSDIVTLIHVLRYWAKRQEVSGSGQMSHSKLTNYALNILIVHFMVNKYGVASPEELAQIASEKTLIDTWDCSLPSTPLPSSPFLPNNPWEMLGDILTFYKDFEFEGKVVVSRTGECKDADYVHDEFKVSCLNVQDPFDLSHNLTLNVNAKNLLLIKKKFTEAHKLYTEAPMGFFPQFFAKSTSPPKPLPDFSVSFNISMSTWQIHPDQVEMAFAAWCVKVTDITQRVITQVLCATTHDGDTAKRAKLSMWSGIFTLGMALWVGRKKVIKTIERTDDHFENEVACSRLLLNTPGIHLPCPITFDLKLTPYVVPLERGVSVTLSPCVNDGQFKAFATFFPSFLTKLVDKSVVVQ